MDEIMWVIIKNKREEVLRETIEDIYGIPNLTVKDVPSSTPLDALTLIEQFHLKPPRDAFHVAVMKYLGLIEIASDDADF